MRNLMQLSMAVLLPTLAVAQPKAHTHGESSLDIGIEGKAGMVEFRVPAEDLYGFEHAPRTAAERAKQTAAFATLRTQAATLIRFDAALGCALTATSVGVVEEKGGHGDVHAKYTLACRVAPAGKPIAFGFSKAFPGVRAVKVQLISDTQQAGLTITNDRGTVRP